ncbi:hypothetical protein [Trichocoleus sp. FACHB-46]|uniref:Uncharacterized protein n=1 Tax=Trichocoleus desertorum GB2-A4 TaxID=2933944 RepID=A0ABV0JFZ2_9CYAN|nr:hypothetical protein [Trichocoleus sp. FACHB-46]MBD1865052.1 hypothetical protein [Trichocoleus sp. FACHB-46]
MTTEFVGGWLHPFAGSDADIGAIWYFASKQCGEATGRRQEASEDHRLMYRNLVKTRLRVDDNLLHLARSDDEIYAELVSRYAQRNKRQLK